MLVRVLLAAIFAGVLAGVFATAVQSYRVIPLILEAEKLEKVEKTAHEDKAADHERTGEVWAPEDGFERLFYTAVANIIIGVAFALILTAGILLTQSAVSLQAGLAWGLAGFVAFVLAPSFGMPPELPGMEAASLSERRIWWAFTTILAVAGLYLFAFKQTLLWMLLGVVLLVAPHVYGAPHLMGHVSAVPANLAAEFVMATIVASILFWLFLGGVLGVLQSRALSRETGAGE